MEAFEMAYQKLNKAQKLAVDTIDGPLLVLAGPGTGKTQLLSARVANILRRTDTVAASILCLTFTEAAALNMRERLVGMIGDDAYDVHISTYHSFASDIIKSYPDFFTEINLETGEDSRMERPINELGQLETVTAIVSELPFSDPLRNARYYIKSVVSVMSDLKQANLSASDVRKLAVENAATSLELSRPIHELMLAHRQIPRKAIDAQALFSSILVALHGTESGLAHMAARELERALEASKENNTTKPLTGWKNVWLHKDENDHWTFTDPAQNEKMLSLARIYEAYQRALTIAGEYDFNDMILKTLHALQTKSELRFNLQERYQYILLDEFQDTNAAQFELVKTLANHPVHEGRPNIMAVGDDDQGIFAFQGADIGNMIQFLHTFREVAVINLTQNYRSHEDILFIAHNVADQIDSRLHHSLGGISKTIEASADDLPSKAIIARHELNSAAAEYGWIADQIAMQINMGVSARQIAVIAPKHAILESLVPFLNKRGIPVTYEKRENIFETPIVQSILLISELLLAISEQRIAAIDELMPRVLSLDFWEIPIDRIWNINWEHARERQEDRKSWTERATTRDVLKRPVLFLLALGTNSSLYGLELVLDYVTGAKAFHADGIDYTSPLKTFYFSGDAMSRSSLVFYESISHLSVIRQNLREQESREDTQLTVKSLLNLYHTYLEAEQPLINTHPIAQAESAVQLLTVYKSKGLEYEYVYLPNMHDSVWGSSVRSAGNKLSLPPNLDHIRHDAPGEDNVRRLLFVAITRAKYGLIMTSHAKTESGKQNMPVKYMQETTGPDGRVSAVLPEANNHIIQTDREPEVLRTDVDTLWHSRHMELTPSLHSLLDERLKHYVMSPTHLNSFTNVEYSGPHTFLLSTLLRFPEAPTPDSIYGDALHRALEQYQKSWGAGEPYTIEVAIESFEHRLQRGFMSDADKLLYGARGARALTTYLRVHGARLQQPAGIEVDFRREGCTLNGAILTGKIDRLEIDSKQKTLRIIDFKSGQPSAKWGSTSKYMAYRQQLYFYALLIETSRTYRGYTVTSAALEFIEPLSNGECAPPLELAFNDAEYARFKQLVTAVWQHIQRLDLPDISSYPVTATGMKQFENYLLDQID